MHVCGATTFSRNIFSVIQQASGIIVKHILNTVNKPEEDGQLFCNIVAPLVLIFHKIKELSKFIWLHFRNYKHFCSSKYNINKRSDD